MFKSFRSELPAFRKLVVLYRLINTAPVYNTGYIDEIPVEKSDEDQLGNVPATRIELTIVTISGSHIITEYDEDIMWVYTVFAGE